MQLSRTVWTLLHAASKHGLEVVVPPKPLPLQSSKSDVKDCTRGVTTGGKRESLPVDEGARQQTGFTRIRVPLRVGASTANKEGPRSSIPRECLRPLNRGQETLTGPSRSGGRGSCDGHMDEMVDMDVACDSSSTDASHSGPVASLAGGDGTPSGHIEGLPLPLGEISGVATRIRNGKGTKRCGSVPADANGGHADGVVVTLSVREGEENLLPPKPRMNQVTLRLLHKTAPKNHICIFLIESIYSKHRDVIP